MIKNLKSGAFFLTLSSFIFMVSGYLINIILGKILPPNEYGIYGIIISIVTFINIFHSASISQSMSKFISEKMSQKTLILKSALILQFISTSLTFGFFYFFNMQIALFFNDIHLANYIRMSAFIFPVYGLYALVSDYFNGLHLFGKQSLLNILYSLIKLSLITLLVLYFNIKGVIYGFILSPLVVLFFVISIRFKLRGLFNLKKILFFSFPIVVFALLFYLIQSIDLILIKVLLKSNEMVGFYTGSQNIARIPYFAMNAFSVVLYPVIAKATVEKNTLATKKIIDSTLRIILLIITPITVLIAANSSLLLEFFYSSQYTQASNSLSILVIGMSLTSFISSIGYILIGSGKPGYSVFITSISLFITSSLCMVLIPKYGLTGAASATTLGSLVAFIVGIYYVRERFNANFNTKSLIKILIAAAVIFYSAKIIPINIFILPFYSILLIILYIGILTLLKEFSEPEIIIINKYLKNTLGKFSKNK